MRPLLALKGQEENDWSQAAHAVSISDRTSIPPTPDRRRGWNLRTKQHCRDSRRIHAKTNLPLGAFANSCIFSPVIKSFADTTRETIFLGGQPSRKDLKKLGGLNIAKAFERLTMLDAADEKRLLLSPSLHYHKLKGSSRYSIDADSRTSPWRIIFQWENDEMKNVQLVTIEDTH
jgi:plasmid maintenance system killer protein